MTRSRQSPVNLWRQSGRTSRSTGRSRESFGRKLRVLVKRILRKYGYPPDKQEKATQTVLQQAEVLSAAWAAV